MGLSRKANGIISDPDLPLAFFTFAAMILLFVTTFGVPFISPIFLLSLTQSNPSLGTFTFGVFGICHDTAGSRAICSSPSVGYSLGSSPDWSSTQANTPIEKAFATFDMPSHTQVLVLHVAPFLITLLILILLTISRFKQHFLARWNFEVTVLAMVLTFICFGVDLSICDSVEKVAEDTASMSRGNGTFLTLVAGLLLAKSALFYKVQTYLRGRDRRDEGDYEMNTLAKPSQTPQGTPEDFHKDKTGIEEEDIFQLRLTLFNLLNTESNGPPKFPTPKRSYSNEATSFMAPHLHSQELSSDIAKTSVIPEEKQTIIPRIKNSTSYRPPQLLTGVLNAEKPVFKLSPSMITQSSDQTRLSPAGTRFSGYAPSDFHTYRSSIYITPNSGEPDESSSPSPSNAVSSSGIQSAWSSRRTSSLKSSKLQRSISTSSSTRSRGTVRRSQRHTNFPMLGQIPSLSLLTLGSVINDFPPVPASFDTPNLTPALPSGTSSSAPYLPTSYLSPNSGKSTTRKSFYPNPVESQGTKDAREEAFNPSQYSVNQTDNEKSSPREVLLRPEVDKVGGK